MINHPASVIAIITFALAYLLVVLEEFIHLRKSKPVIFAASIIWLIIAYISQKNDISITTLIRLNILEYAELLLFLLVAMIYINAINEYNFFSWINNKFISLGFSFKKIFWLTGFLSFFISPIADNLTTAMIMSSIIISVGKSNKKFITLSCINIVIASNAGGAFSPFGDITTLMVWQKGILNFYDFFKIFIPSFISYIIPSLILSIFLPKSKIISTNKNVKMHLGCKRIILLFILTITTSIFLHYLLHLPPVIGMMFGFSYLQIFSYYMKISKFNVEEKIKFDIFRLIQNVEWDTLFFFYGIIMCVGGLSTIGYLNFLSDIVYFEWGSYFFYIHHQTLANIIFGCLSAIIDNIPIMFAIITMKPIMSEGQWLLATLTSGIGGSLLSVGSAAGIAVMGQSKGYYTFFSHLKWSWAILIGYLLSIYSHIFINKQSFYIVSYYF